MLESEADSGVQPTVKPDHQTPDLRRRPRAERPIAGKPSGGARHRRSPDLAFLNISPITPKSRVPEGFSGPSAHERMLFFRSFAALFGAGIPLERALAVLSDQATSPGFKLLLTQITQDVHHGHSLTSVFAGCPEVFSAYHVRMMRVGEMTGRMDQALDQLALFEERSSELNLKLKSALTYPFWTMVLAILFLLFVPPYLMEGLFDAVSTSGQELPALTVFVQSVFMVTKSFFFQVVVGTTIAALLYTYPKWSRSPRLKSWIISTAVKMPWTRKLAQSLITARFARSISSMLEAGVPPALSLRLAGEEVGTFDSKVAGIQALYCLENGWSFPKAVEQIPHLRNYFHEMLRAGEETGTMPDLTMRAAVLAEEEVSHQLELFCALLEPLTMIFIGGVVGVLVISSMLPLLTLLDTL